MIFRGSKQSHCRSYLNFYIKNVQWPFQCLFSVVASSHCSHCDALLLLLVLQFLVKISSSLHYRMLITGSCVCYEYVHEYSV